MKSSMEIPERGRKENPYATEVLFKGPKEGIGDLKCLKGRDDEGQAYVASYWELNETERDYLFEQIQAGNDIIVELIILGEGIPPVAVNLI